MASGLVEIVVDRPADAGPALATEPQIELAMILDEQKRRIEGAKLYYYRPYPKQQVFHDAGALMRERMFLAGNRVGKTECGAAETAIHMTGLYPEWWAGRRFHKAVRVWCAGVTNVTTRDILQQKLIGPLLGQPGTGMIPRHALTSTTPARGIAEALDMFTVKHVSGGTSIAWFKSYEQGRAKFQGAALELVWLDEEPDDYEIYSESLTRTNETSGLVMVTMTPLLGQTKLTQRFLGA